MLLRHSAFALALALALALGAHLAAQNAAAPAPPPVGGCPPVPAAFHKCALEKAKTFTPPRTRSGKPDLQGFWRGRLSQSFSVEGVRGDEPLVGSDVMPWEIAPPMVVDPPDGRIPYQPWAVPIGRIGVNYNQYLDPRTACGSGGVPRLALQDANQILQPDGDAFIVWLHEDHHVQRVIAMDGRPALGTAIKVTNGDSRGRWEGNTLVIDSNNFNGYNWFDDSGNFYTDNVHLVERLTMIDRDTIHYEVRVDDAKVYTRPWTLVWAQVREKEPGFELLEEACREGQRDLGELMRGGIKFYFDPPWRGR